MRHDARTRSSEGNAAEREERSMLPSRLLVMLFSTLLVIAVSACADSQPELSLSPALMSEPGSDGTAAIYFTLTNTGGQSDDIVGASVDGANMVHFHQSVIDDAGSVSMEQSGPETVDADSELLFRPGGKHLMAEFPQSSVSSLADGDTLEMTLQFSRSEEIATNVTIARPSEILDEVGT